MLSGRSLVGVSWTKNEATLSSVLPASLLMRGSGIAEADTPELMCWCWEWWTIRPFFQSGGWKGSMWYNWQGPRESRLQILTLWSDSGQDSLVWAAARARCEKLRWQTSGSHLDTSWNSLRPFVCEHTFPLLLLCVSIYPEINFHKNNFGFLGYLFIHNIR